MFNFTPEQQAEIQRILDQNLAEALEQAIRADAPVLKLTVRPRQAASSVEKSVAMHWSFNAHRDADDPRNVASARSIRAAIAVLTVRWVKQIRNRERRRQDPDHVAQACADRILAALAELNTLCGWSSHETLAFTAELQEARIPEMVSVDAAAIRHAASGLKNRDRPRRRRRRS